jgi:hypothetical protein
MERNKDQSGGKSGEQSQNESREQRQTTGEHGQNPTPQQQQGEETEDRELMDDEAPQTPSGSGQQKKGDSKSQSNR